jgi:hypothetical protein
MTQIAVTEQIEAIKKATQEALKTKESALQFLIDAGIVKDKKKAVQPASSNNR